MLVHVEYAPQRAHEALVGECPPAGAETLKPLDYCQAGGSKAFEDDIYAGAFNYLDMEQFAAWFAGLPWGKMGNATLSMSDGEARAVLVVERGKVQVASSNALIAITER